MNKLTEYLNEYEPRIASDGEHYDNIWLFRTKMSDKIVRDNAISYIISARYGFIKWLVDNDKIDYTQLEGYSLWETVKNDGWTNYICLLMILAASDSPIDLLCILLK